MRLSFKAKLKEVKDLIANGRYKQLLSRISDGILNITDHRNSRKLKYLYLKKKYSAFIAERVKDNLRNRGGGQTTETPNIIWWLWLQGVDKAPDVCKAGLRSLRRWHPDKKIITLDSNNLHEYITIPDYINEKHARGIIDNTKYSNLVRLLLLIEYGGSWIDSTFFCTGRKFEYIMHLPLFLIHDYEQLSFFTVASNELIVAAPHNPVLMLTRDLYLQYWKDFDYCLQYMFFHMLFKLATEAYPDEWERVPFIPCLPHFEMQYAMYSDYTEEKMQHFKEVFDFHKLTYKLDPEHMPSEKSIYHHVVYDE